MNIYIILIPLIVLIIYYFIHKFYIKKNINYYFKHNNPKCSVDTDNPICKEFNNIDNDYFDFTSTESYNINNILYIIKLIEQFLIYLNTDYENNKLNIKNLYDQKLIKSNYNKIPVCISYSNKDKTSVFFIFRGSLTNKEIIKYVSLKKNPNRPSHKYYNLIYNNIKQQLLDCLYSNTKNIYICGYSMGACISYIMANDVDVKYNVNVFGIGAPKIGTNEFADSLKSKCKYLLNVINLADIVTTISMPNFTKFKQITPILTFNKFNKSILDTHNLFSYYDGIKNEPLNFEK
jgi:hypothetical protein